MKTKPRLQEGHLAKTIGISLSYAELEEVDRLCKKHGVGVTELFRKMLKLWLDTDSDLPREELSDAWRVLLKDYTIEKKTS